MGGPRPLDLGELDRENSPEGDTLYVGQHLRNLYSCP